MSSSQSTRRDFLRTSAGLAAAGAGSCFFATRARAATKEKAPNRPKTAAEKTRTVHGDWNIAAIGVGGRGSGIGHSAAGFGNLVACCDVDRAHAEKFASK